MTEVSLDITSDVDSDAVRELADWLMSDDALYGNVRLTVPSAATGTMGAGVPELAVLLGPGGVAAAFASVVIAWLRRRTGSLSLCIRRPDGTEIRLAAENIRPLAPEEIRAQVAQLAAEVASETTDDRDLPGRS